MAQGPTSSAFPRTPTLAPDLTSRSLCRPPHPPPSAPPQHRRYHGQARRGGQQHQGVPPPDREWAARAPTGARPRSAGACVRTPRTRLALTVGPPLPPPSSSHACPPAQYTECVFARKGSPRPRPSFVVHPPGPRFLARPPATLLRLRSYGITDKGVPWSFKSHKEMKTKQSKDDVESLCVARDASRAHEPTRPAPCALCGALTAATSPPRPRPPAPRSPPPAASAATRTTRTSSWRSRPSRRSARSSRRRGALTSEEAGRVNGAGCRAGRLRRGRGRGRGRRGREDGARGAEAGA